MAIQGEKVHFSIPIHPHYKTLLVNSNTLLPPASEIEPLLLSLFLYEYHKLQIIFVCCSCHVVCSTLQCIVDRSLQQEAFVTTYDCLG